FSLIDLSDCDPKSGEEADINLNNAIDLGDGPDEGVFSFYTVDPTVEVDAVALTPEQVADFNVAVGTDEIWVKLSSGAVGGPTCSTVKSFDIDVYSNPEFSLIDLSDCEATAGEGADFNLNNAIDLSGDGPDEGVFSFYTVDPTVEVDAVALTPEQVADSFPARRSADLWVKLSSGAVGRPTCSTVRSFDIDVYSNPEFSLIDLSDCEATAG